MARPLPPTATNEAPALVLVFPLGMLVREAEGSLAAMVANMFLPRVCATTLGTHLADGALGAWRPILSHGP